MSQKISIGNIDIVETFNKHNQITISQSQKNTPQNSIECIENAESDKKSMQYKTPSNNKDSEDKNSISNQYNEVFSEKLSKQDHKCLSKIQRDLRNNKMSLEFSDEIHSANKSITNSQLNKSNFKASIGIIDKSPLYVNTDDNNEISFDNDVLEISSLSYDEKQENNIENIQNNIKEQNIIINMEITPSSEEKENNLHQSISNNIPLLNMSQKILIGNLDIVETFNKQNQITISQSQKNTPQNSIECIENAQSDKKSMQDKILNSKDNGNEITTGYNEVFSEKLSKQDHKCLSKIQKDLRNNKMSLGFSNEIHGIDKSITDSQLNKSNIKSSISMIDESPLCVNIDDNNEISFDNDVLEMASIPHDKGLEINKENEIVKNVDDHTSKTILQNQKNTIHSSIERVEIPNFNTQNKSSLNSQHNENRNKIYVEQNEVLSEPTDFNKLEETTSKDQNKISYADDEILLPNGTREYMTQLNNSLRNDKRNIKDYLRSKEVLFDSGRCSKVDQPNSPVKSPERLSDKPNSFDNTNSHNQTYDIFGISEGYSSKYLSNIVEKNTLFFEKIGDNVPDNILESSDKNADICAYLHNTPINNSSRKYNNNIMNKVENKEITGRILKRKNINENPASESKKSTKDNNRG